jgi:hypothetical protein
MTKWVPWIAGGLAVAAAVMIGWGIAGATDSSDSSHGRRPSLARIHARNVQLQTLLVMLMQSKGNAPATKSQSSGTAHRLAPAVISDAGSKSEPDASACDPTYEGECLDANASDYDCSGGSGDGPKYAGEVTIVGDDHFGLDLDADGIGCEP